MNQKSLAKDNKSDLRFDLNRYKQASKVAYDYAKKQVQNEDKEETEEEDS